MLLQKEIPPIVRWWGKKEIAQCVRIYVGDHPYITYYQILSSFDPLPILHYKTINLGPKAGKIAIFRHPNPPTQCVELKLRWRFCVHSSKCPEIYF